MNQTSCQRWRDQRDAYRPPDERINPIAYEVAPIADDKTAKGFVLAHHYSGRYPAARFRFGLYRGADLVGVAVFSHPENEHVIPGTFPGLGRLDAVNLGRFVLLDAVPGNGETWFLARCFAQLRRIGLAGVLSYSDPGKRLNAAGQTVFGGHVGTIYQAHNGVYLGRSKARYLVTMPSGVILNERAISKVRRRVKGWQYVVRDLVADGAVPPLPGQDLAVWLKATIDALCRRVRHHGNHKYAWSLARSVKLPVGLAYPKQLDLEMAA